jgi:starch synthase
MNLVVNDLDMPLIIKVASYLERIQVYFIDNDEYLKGKQHLQMKKGLCIQIMMSDAISFAKELLKLLRN